MVIAIVSKAWEDSSHNTREVFWKSRIDVLFQHSYFEGYFTRVEDGMCQRLFQFVDRHDESSIKEEDSSSMSVWNMVVLVWKNKIVVLKEEADSSSAKSVWDMVVSSTELVWNMVMSTMANIFLFVLGLLTLGLFWPTKLRRGILSAGIRYS